MVNIIETKENVEPRLKVRLTTSVYCNGNRATFKKELYFYRRPNPEHLPESVTEDLTESEYPQERIINLYEVPDGIYEMVWCHITQDWETGYINDWDLRLILWQE